MSGSKARRAVAGVALALLIVAVLVAIYAITFGPGHYANLQSEQSNGKRIFAVASASSGDAAALVTPADGWSVQPLVQEIQVPILKDLPKPPLPKDPRVMLGMHHGITVKSPDLALTVELSVVGSDDKPDSELAAELEVLAETQAEAANEDAAQEGKEGRSDEIRTELLASGHTLRYVEGGEHGDTMLAFIDLGSLATGDESTGDDVATGDSAATGDGAVVRMRVSFDPPTKKTGSTLADYRPALSALFESVSAK